MIERGAEAIKAVLFDMDGVLIDAKEWHYEALNKALGLFGLVEIILFIVTVFVAYAYVWRRGGLDWD